MQFAGNRRQLAKIGKVVDENPPGTTLCANGRWSTNPPAPGVCSYNGGWIVNYPDLSRSLQAKAKKKPSALVLDVQNNIQPQETPQIVSNKVLVPYENEGGKYIEVATIKKEGTKYYHLSPGYLGRKEKTEVFPISYGLDQRLQEYLDNLQSKDNYAEIYAGLLAVAEGREKMFLQGNVTAPYLIPGVYPKVNSALLKSDLNQKGYKQLLPFLLDNLEAPKAASKPSALVLIDQEQTEEEKFDALPLSDRAKILRELIRSKFPGVSVQIIDQSAGFKAVEITHPSLSTMAEIGQFLYNNCEYGDPAKRSWLKTSEARGVIIDDRLIKRIVFCDALQNFKPAKPSKPSALILQDAPAADPAPVPPPAPVEAMGTWFETTYTTRKGKTGPALAIDFDQKPPREVLDILRDSRFWWSRQDLVWYGWDNEANREVIEALPVVQEAREEQPRPQAQPIPQVKREAPPKPLPETIPAKEYNFPIPPPKRGRLYNNDEWFKIRYMVSHGQNWKTHNSRNLGKAPAFPQFKKLWADIVKFDKWGEKNVPQWGRLFSESYSLAETLYARTESTDHPMGFLDFKLKYLYDDLTNTYGNQKHGFDKYRNRDKDDVQEYIEQELTTILNDTRERLQFMNNPLIYNPNKDPQQFINDFTGRYGKKDQLSQYFIKRVIENIHKIEFNSFLRAGYQDKYNKSFYESDLWTGKLTLAEAKELQRAAKEKHEQSNLESYRTFKKRMKELHQFNIRYLQAGRALHLPTYVKELKKAGISRGIEYNLSNDIEILGRNRGEEGRRILIPRNPDYQVEFIIYYVKKWIEHDKKKPNTFYYGRLTPKTDAEYLEMEMAIEAMREPAEVMGFIPRVQFRTLRVLNL